MRMCKQKTETPLLQSVSSALNEGIIFIQRLSLLIMWAPWHTFFGHQFLAPREP